MSSTPPTTAFEPRRALPRPPGSQEQAPSFVPPTARRQRRWSLALVALLVTLGSALAFVVLWMNAGNRKPVLALKRDVPAGQVIAAEDLTTVRVATDPGISPVPSSERDDVIGKPASTDLLAGTLLVPDAVGKNEGLEDNMAQLAIPVEPARFPALERGNSVSIIQTEDGASPSGEEGGPSVIGEGRVLDVQRDEDNSNREITVLLTVDQELVMDIQAAVAANQISLAKIAND